MRRLGIRSNRRAIDAAVANRPVRRRLPTNSAGRTSTAAGPDIDLGSVRVIDSACLARASKADARANAKFGMSRFEDEIGAAVEKFVAIEFKALKVNLTPDAARKFQKLVGDLQRGCGSYARLRY